MVQLWRRILVSACALLVSWGCSSDDGDGGAGDCADPTSHAGPEDPATKEEPSGRRVPEVLDGPRGPLSGALVINEVYTKHQEDWVELYNGTDREIDLSGYRVVDDKARYIVPEGTKLPSGRPIAFYREKMTPDNFFSLHEDEDLVRLEDPSRNVLDEIRWSETFSGQSLARNVDGSGDFVVGEPTPGRLNHAP